MCLVTVNVRPSKLRSSHTTVAVLRVVMPAWLLSVRWSRGAGISRLLVDWGERGTCAIVLFEGSFVKCISIVP